MVTRGSRGVAGPRPLSCRSLAAIVVTLVLLAAAAAPALASGAAGSGWVADSGNAGGYTTSLSCPTAMFCAAVDWNGQAVTYNGHVWEPPKALKPDKTTSQGTFGVPLTGVSCASASFCVAVDHTGDAFTYNGSAWSRPTAIDPGVQLNSVSCPASSYCQAADVSGNAFVYQSGRWTSDPGAGYDELACSSPGACIFQAQAPLVGPYAGQTGGVTCLSSGFCMVASGGGAIFDGPSSGELNSAPSVGRVVSGVSCASEIRCVAIDGENSIDYVYDGTHWTSSKYGGIYRLNAVSCVPAGVCVTVDSVGDVSSYPTALPGSATAGAGGPPPTASQVRVNLRSLLRANPTRRSIAELLRRGDETLRWQARYAGRLTLTLDVITKGRPVSVATANVSFAKPGGVKVVLRPTRSGRRLLASTMPLKVVLDATFTPKGATAATLSRTVVIR
jgi:hypothetical protein